MEPAVFFDGRSSRRHIVALAFTDRLEIANPAVPDGPLLAVWPYDAIRRVDSPEGALRLACATAPPLARLELRDPAERANVLRLCRSLDGPGSAGSISLGRIVAASIAAAAAIIGTVWFGMPVLANRLAAVIPYAWEMPLGDAVDSQVRELIGSPSKAGGRRRATQNGRPSTDRRAFADPAGSDGAALAHRKRLRSAGWPHLRALGAAEDIRNAG